METIATATPLHDAHHGVISHLQLQVVDRENTAVVVYPVHSKLCSWDGTCRHQVYIQLHITRLHQTHRHTFEYFTVTGDHTERSNATQRR